MSVLSDTNPIPNSMKLNTFRLLVLMAACLIGTDRVYAGTHEDAKQWLERMIQAAHTLSYEGTFVYVQGQSVEAMRIVHFQGEGSEWQHMTSLNGALREVVVADDKVMCLLPGQQVVFSGAAPQQSSPFPIALPQDLSNLEANYEFSLLDDDRVAGFPAQVIAIQPRDDLRFGYRLWLERETGMVLRSALLDDHDNIIEQLIFIELSIKAGPDALQLAPPASVKAKIAAKVQDAPAGEVVVDSAWLVTQLPQGFTQVLHNRYANTTTASPTEHIVFTDGLATVSVFLEKLEKLDGTQAQLNGPTRMGAMNGYATIVNDHQVMVMGEVPEATVALIGASLKHTTAGAAP